MAAIKAGDVDKTQRLLSSGADVNSIGHKLTSMEDNQDAKLPSCPLLWAVIKRDAAIVKILLDAGANPEVPCDLRIPGLPESAGIIGHAVQNGDMVIVRYLLEAGIDVSRLLNSSFHGFFKRAAWSNPHLLDIFVQYGADIKSADASGNTDLHKAVRYLRQDSFSVVERLLDLGMDVNLPNSHTGLTPLMLAISVKSPQAVVELLLARGADPHSKDRKERNALHWAAKKVNLWAIGRLLQENVDLESKRNHHNKQLTTYEYLYETCRKSFVVTRYEWTKPFYCLRAMNILIKAGAKLSSSGDTELVKELLWFREQADMIYKEPLRANCARGIGMEGKHLEEIHNILETLLWKCSNVDTLRHLCRIKIRTILKFNFKKRLQILCLPKVLYDYVLMNELLPSELGLI